MTTARIGVMLLLLLFSGQITCCFAQGASPRAAKIDSFLTVLSANQLFNGSILVTEKGQTVYQKSFGYLDFARQIPHTDTTPFNLASLSKPFTAIVVLQMAEKKKFDLDDSFKKFFPDFIYPNIKIRHLLAQTSGLPILERYEDQYVKTHPDEQISNKQAYQHLIGHQLPLLFPPGENWRYNNANYVLLALLVEKVSGMDFGKYLQKCIFGPSKMLQTFVREANMPNTPRYVRANMYTHAYTCVDSLDRKREYTYYNLGALAGPNNVISTIRDLALFDRALTAGRLISPNMMEKAFKPLVLNSGKIFLMGGSTRSYGLGWNVYTSKTEPLDHFAFHDGHIVGLSTVLHKNLTKDQTIILYDNTDNNPIQVMVGISNILKGAAPPQIRTTRSLARIYGETIVQDGPDFAASKLNELKGDSAHYHVDELEFNRLGFDLLRTQPGQLRQYALEVFKINTLLFPKSGNTYDSYAHALAKLGKKQPAIAMYRKSIALSPGNEEGKRALQQLLDAKE